ncbi:monodechloroaminopyrrolnitrin synthase PrnB family protein [Streptomyces sp. NPDC058548]|uniref:monodechloroaminopyrrolnitrin synthase PrnB family protein n=1 Tax=unclassified Streptomyces TaxID=2593676 RepID=UPI00364E7916
MDAKLPSLWEMNDRADLPALVSLLRTTVPTPEHVADFTTLDCVAAMRDLGMLIGSVKRHGTQPVETVPEVEPVLIGLGARTAMIPRDTVHHYATWNPTGPRERRYTGLSMESSLIASVRASVPQLRLAIEVCRRLRDIEPAEPEFGLATHELADLLTAMNDAIETVRKHVTPEFFALTMRPFFEDIRVAGTDYLGPAAGHVPLSLIDLAVWASDQAHPDYQEFCQKGAIYGMPIWRDLYQEWANGPSLITRLSSALNSAATTPLRPNLSVSLEGFQRALRALVVFRGKHITIARKAYRDGLGLYTTGSGGAGVDMLAEILDLTRERGASISKTGDSMDVPSASGRAER